MNILFCSVPFRPSVGGIETVSALLAERFQRQGHRVILVTQTPAAEVDTEAYEVVRRPSTWKLWQLVGWADVVFHNNISLRFAWPQLLLRRPWVVAHHTWIPTRGMAGRIKRLVIHRASNIAVSRSLASSLKVDCYVIPNPYADDVFVRMVGTQRHRQLIFVGRLVSEKGVHVLIDALALLARRGRQFGLTVVGDGPELSSLQAQTRDLGVADQVVFSGFRAGTGLAHLLNEHQVLVLPSTCEETFGVVVLEALACGCVPLVSRRGGLPDAVGPCGVLVPSGDEEALSRSIDQLLSDGVSLDRFRAAAAAHLERHTRDRVAHEYVQIISSARNAHTKQIAPSVT